MVMLLVNGRVQWRGEMHGRQVRQRSRVIPDRDLNRIIMRTRMDAEREEIIISLLPSPAHLHKHSLDSRQSPTGGPRPIIIDDADASTAARAIAAHNKVNLLITLTVSDVVSVKQRSSDCTATAQHLIPAAARVYVVVTQRDAGQHAGHLMRLLLLLLVVHLLLLVLMLLLLVLVLLLLVCQVLLLLLLLHLRVLLAMRHLLLSGRTQRQR